MARRSKGERGLALIAVLILMVLLLGIGAAFHTGIIAETGLRGAQARATAGFYAAEAGINRGMGDYRNIFMSFSFPSGSDFAEKSLLLGPRTVKYQMTQAGAPNQSWPVPAGKPFAGLNAIRNVYIATASSELNTGDVEANLGTEFDVDLIPLFQFLAFYANTLEILPGPTMTLNGPIHTNGDLYLNSNNTLSIVESAQVPTVNVSAVGSIVRGRKDQPGTCTGVVTIASLQDQNGNGQLDPINMACGGNQTDAQLSVWLGSIRARQPTIAVPTPSVLARGSGTFWMNADLRIVLDLDSPDSNGRFPIVAVDVNGNVDPVANPSLQTFMSTYPGVIFYNDVPETGRDQDLPCTDAASYCHPASYSPDFGAPDQVYRCGRSLHPLNLYGACPTIVEESLSGGSGKTYRRGGFRNNRENAWVYMLNVNMRDLLWWNRSGPMANAMFVPDETSDGGIVVFLSVKGPGSTGAIPSPRYGVRVFGSPDLDFPPAANPTGLTVASDQAMYVEGSYNVGDAVHPWVPASLLGDTINVLSAGWSGNVAARNDYQSRKPLNQRLAANTTINTAFIGGVDTTFVGNYNGGFENYPRFHEDWSGGRQLTYLGSFVSLGNPQRNNGIWCGTGGACNIYNPPVRAWNFDARFQQAQSLPPMTPQVVSVNQILFTENFR
jgi:hypothetical protein